MKNNFSLVTAVTFGNIKLIFGGDAEGERMTEYLPLAEARGFTSCTLFKIPHHGALADRGLLEAIRAWKLTLLCGLHGFCRVGILGDCHQHEIGRCRALLHL